MSQEIDHEMAFNWWVNTVLKKTLRMISLIKKRNALYLKKTHRFGIKVHKSVAQEYSLYEINDNTIWAYAFPKR